jgi:hypothetical protein
LVWGFKAYFVKRFAVACKVVVDATREYVNEVQSSTFPALEHAFGVAKDRTAPAENTGNKPVVAGTPPSYGPASDES